jgi:anti-anti-sigma regulatory factor
MSASAASQQTMGRLDVRIDREGDTHLVVLVGQIDDQATLSEIVDRLGPKVVIDLAGVRFINSIGVREWIGLLRGLDDKQAKVALRNCSEPMVHQMNMVMEARGAATVESFHVPYVCDNCGGTVSQVLPVAPHAAELKARKVPTRPCPDCGGTMQFDDFPNRYLIFLD